MSYGLTVGALEQRIWELAQQHREQVMKMTNPFDLFKLGLDVTGLAPSLAQAQVALARVRHRLTLGDAEDPRGPAEGAS